MLAVKGDIGTPSSTLHTGMVASVLVSPAAELAMSALARCWGVVGNPGGVLGGRAAAGGAAETRGGVHGVGVDDAELVVAVGGDALGVGGSGGAALAVGSGRGAAFLTGGGGADDDTLLWLPPPSSPMTIVSWVPRCCWSPALATQWVSSVV